MPYTKPIEHQLKNLFLEFVDHMQEEDAEELALRVIIELRKKGMILPNFSKAPKYILMMEMEETPQLQKLEKLLDNPEMNLNINM